jgi:hypothetical protein
MPRTLPNVGDVLKVVIPGLCAEYPPYPEYVTTFGIIEAELAQSVPPESAGLNSASRISGD